MAAPDTNLLLLSAPWASPLRPSIQLGVLKAYVESLDDLKHVKVSILSPHLGILIEAAGGDFPELYSFCETLGETLFQLVYYKLFGFPNIAFDEAQLLSAIKGIAKGNDETDSLLEKITLLTEGTLTYIRRRVLPKISSTKLNVIAFTLNFNQVYASLTMIRFISALRPNARIEFVLGGHSVSIPRIRTTISELEVSAFLCTGEGELKLAKLLTELTAGSSISSILASCSGITHSKYDTPFKHLTDKANQLNDLTQLKLPSYDEYFEELRSYADSDSTYQGMMNSVIIMLEGSRGCFAKCDFCGFNTNWAGFRKLGSDSVFEKTVSVALKYKCKSVFYVDNVCDTWAQGYADRAIDADNEIEGYMELRAHHPEAFWVSMRLAKVNTIQVGVEALSEDLIKKMQKGTKLIQNIRAQKYISELGIRSGANLITFHPKSTVQDVAGTKHVLSRISHFASFNLSRFAVSIGSPIYEELSDTDKAIANNLLSINRLHGPLTDFELDWRYALPRPLSLTADVENAWLEFEGWHQQLETRRADKRPELSCKKVGDSIRVFDTRSDTVMEHWIHGSEAVVLDLCHEGLTRVQLKKLSGLNGTELEFALERLVMLDILLLADDHYINLSLRSEDSLIRKYTTKNKKGAIDGLNLFTGGTRVEFTTTEIGK